MANPTNMPGARDDACCWTGPDDQFYVFGGFGFPATGSSSRLNDLWRFNVADENWTWVKGANTTLQSGNYVINPGTAWIQNTPGARRNPCCWTGIDGRLYVFGGEGLATSGPVGNLNDLWCFDPLDNNWTYIKGFIGISQTGIYGTQGIPRSDLTPGARRLACCWTGSDGQLYLFGGLNTSSRLNDLWRFNLSDNNWVWIKGSNGVNQLGIYGTQGIPGSDLTPGARNAAACWMRIDGRFYLFGGDGLATSITSGQLNDLWCFNVADNNWTWLKGASDINQAGNYGAFRVPAATNTPGARNLPCSWVGLDGNLYLFGGNGSGGTSFFNDLWRFSLSDSNWTWIKGFSDFNRNGIYGTQGVPRSDLTPGARVGACCWTGSDGGLYLFGGLGFPESGVSGRLNDLWCFNLSDLNWTWLKGTNNIGLSPVYGEAGVAKSDNTPGGRNNACCLEGADGQFYLFGGLDTTGNNRFNDLWRFNLADQNWTWVKGSNTTNHLGIYGHPIARSDATPGAREQACCWTGPDDLLYLFGGFGQDAAGGANNLNDLWAFNVLDNNWLWVRGSNTVSQFGTYGVQGITNPNSLPGARNNACCWLGADGQLYVFGGTGLGVSGSAGLLNDLWRFNVSDQNWAWLKGANTTGQFGIYTSDSTATPGARQQACCWTGSDGNLYLFGGNGLDAFGTTGRLNDLWCFDISTNNWTWLYGRNTVDTLGTYWAGLDNKPGARQEACCWTMDACFYLFGGNGYATSATAGQLNDLWAWRFDQPFTSMTGSCAPITITSTHAERIYAVCNIGSKYFFEWDLIIEGEEYEFWFSDRKLASSDVMVFVDCTSDMSDVSVKQIVLCE